MNENSWKRRISGLPVVGNLVTGLVGTFTLKVWRAAMRQDIHELRQRAEEAERRYAQLLRRVEEQERKEPEGPSEEMLRSTCASMLAVSLSDIEGKIARQSDRIAHLGECVNACQSDVTHLHRNVRMLTAQRCAPQEAVSASRDGEARVAVARRVPLADDSMARQPYRHLFLHFENEGDARLFALHEHHPDTWLALLEREPPGSLAVVMALAGAQALATETLQAVLDAAWRALRADGVLIIQYDNPENLLVASTLLQAEPPCHPVSPERAKRLVREAGFGDCTIMRSQAGDVAERLAGEGVAIDRLNQLLCGPRVFAVVGHKAG